MTWNLNYVDDLLLVLYEETILKLCLSVLVPLAMLRSSLYLLLRFYVKPRVDILQENKGDHWESIKSIHQMGLLIETKKELFLRTLLLVYPDMVTLLAFSVMIALALQCNHISKPESVQVEWLMDFLDINTSSRHEHTCKRNYFVFALLWLTVNVFRRFYVNVEKMLSGIAQLLNIEDAGKRGMFYVVVMFRFFGFVVTVFTALTLLGFDIASLLGAISVSGLVVGIAAREIIQEFLSAIVIWSTRPFQEGDLINYQSSVGEVIWVGLRSTCLRLRFQGTLLYIPNSLLVHNKIENLTNRSATPVSRNAYYPMTLRRDTGIEQLNKVEGIVRGVFQAAELTRFYESPNKKKPVKVSFGRCWIKTPTLHGYEFDVMYQVECAAIGKYREVESVVSKLILNELVANGFNFAFVGCMNSAIT